MVCEVKTIALMLFNFITSTAIVLVNKIVFYTYGFNYPAFVSVLHFIAIYIGLKLCQIFGLYQPKKLKHSDVLPISLLFSSSVVFNNFSLRLNSVGFYLVLQAIILPIIVILEHYIYKIPFSTVLKLCVAPVSIGVVLAFVYDVSFILIGFLWALAGLFASVFFQCLVKIRQQALQVHSLQLLEYLSLESIILVSLCTPFFDQISGSFGLIEYPFTIYSILAIFLSCVLCFCVYLSAFFVNSRTSPVSLQMLDYLKLLGIFSVTIFIFDEDLNSWRLFGMLLIFVGILPYTIFKFNIASRWEKIKDVEMESESCNTESNETENLISAVQTSI